MEIKEMIDVVTTALQPLADKLGTTAQYTWSLQVKQAYVDGSIALVAVLFGILMIIPTIYLNWKYKNEYEFELWATLSIIPITIGLGLVFLNIKTVFTCFINPEYYAIQQLIYLVK